MPPFPAAFFFLALFSKTVFSQETPPNLGKDVENDFAKPPQELLAIDNGSIKVGIDRAKGAAITWLSWASYSTERGQLMERVESK